MTRSLIDISHVIEHAIVTYPGIPCSTQHTFISPVVVYAR